MEKILSDNGLAEEIHHQVKLAHMFLAVALMGEGQQQLGLQLADKVIKDVVESVDNDELHPFTEKFYSILVNTYVKFNKGKAYEF